MKVFLSFISQVFYKAHHKHFHLGPLSFSPHEYVFWAWIIQNSKVLAVTLGSRHAKDALLDFEERPGENELRKGLCHQTMSFFTDEGCLFISINIQHCTGNTISHSWKAPVWQSNVFTFRALCVTGTHKMESTFMFPISDGLIFHLFCARPLSFVTWRTPLSQRRTNEADLRPTHMRWIHCGVLMRWRRRLRILSPLYAPFPFLKRRVGGWLLSVHSLHLLSQSLDLNFFSLLFPPSLPFFHFTQFPPLFSCASHLSFSAVCSTVCAFPTALCPLLLSVCVLRRNRESV